MSQGSYRKSFSRGSHSMGDAGRSKGLLHTVFTIVLLIALVAVLIGTIPATQFSKDYHTITVERIQKECDTAVTYSRYLSRTASSNSNAELAVIRSSVYTIQVLNETYASLNGGGAYLLDGSLTSVILTTLENYYNRLTTGVNTSDQQTELSNELDALQQAAIKLK